jgi:PadR family transcriptional regulator PadR
VGKVRRLSDEAAIVLELFAGNPSDEIYGRQIIGETGIRSGSLYPILHRLEERGMLLADWERLDDAVDARRRPRRFYRLNPEGADRASAALAEWRRARRPQRPTTSPKPAVS